MLDILSKGDVKDGWEQVAFADDIRSSGKLITGINITPHGRKHLESVIGSEEYKKEYVGDMVKKWVEKHREDTAASCL